MFEGDVNLSCTMTFLSSLGSFAFTTLWVWLLGTPLVGRAVTIPYLQLTVSLASFTVELETKAKRRFGKILQSQRRPTLGPPPD